MKKQHQAEKKAPAPEKAPVPFPIWHWWNT